MTRLATPLVRLSFASAMVLAGCSVAPATTTAAEQSFPVLVGPVPRIGATPQEVNGDGRPFAVSAKSIHHRIPQWNQYHAKTTRSVADPAAVGKELATMTATYPNRRVKIDEVEIGSSVNGWWFLGAIYGGLMKAETSIDVRGSLVSR